jgi:type I restriction enzyme S subunit
MMTYETYKDSGIEWLGNVPKHWNNHRIDWIAQIVRGNTGFKRDELLDKGEYVALQYGKTYKVDIVDNDFKFFVNSEFYKKSQIVSNGDTILISTSETIEDLGHTCHFERDDLGLLGGEQILLKPKRQVLHAKFLYYYSRKFCSELRKDATGLKVFRFNTDDLKQVSLAIPPIEEQQSIAQYLDTKTQAIDKKIELLVQKVDYYKELRKSLINDAVSKGLDKSVKLKDSGIDWIGQIPEHWEVERFKDSFDLKTGNSISDKGAFEVKEKAHFYVSTKDININSGAINYDNGLYVPIADKSFKRAKINSTLICIEGANAGKKIGFTEKEICFVNKLCSIKGKKKTVHDKYHYYFINSKAFNNQFTSLISGLIGGVSINQIKFFNVLMPPVKEQTKIAQYLDQKTTTIDNIVQNITDQIDRLKELRKTVINDVVTGKIRVGE